MIQVLRRGFNYFQLLTIEGLRLQYSGGLGFIFLGSKRVHVVQVSIPIQPTGHELS
jgi:hypothetical protein